MTKTTKTLLVLSIVSLVVGVAFVSDLINVQATVALYVVLPMGAIFLGLFLIFRMMEKEVSLYDEEHHAHPAVQLDATNEKNSDCDCAGQAHQKSAAAH